MKAQRIDAAKSSDLVNGAFRNGRLSAKRKVDAAAGVMRPLLAVISRAFALAAVLSTIQALPAWAAARNVDGANPACSNVTGTPYCTIQPAIDAASPGDTINVYPGSYNVDEANGRDPITGSAGGNNFNIFVGKAVTIQGVTAAGVPITNPGGVAAFVIAKRDLPTFGADAIFVQADNVTITGLDISGYDSPAFNNKTVEVTGDNFTLKYSKVHALDQVASVYIDDSHYNTATDTSHVQSYRIEGNLIDGGGPDAWGIYISSGAGWSGAVSGRVIAGNTISNCMDGIAFVGPGANTWDLYPVGAATITGNTFGSNDRRQVIAWGAYGAGLGYAAPDWKGILSSNIFDQAVTVWTPTSQLRTWDCTGCGSPDISNIGGIYTAIQRYPINRVAQSGDTIDVAAGTYVTTSQVIIDKNLTISGAGAASTSITVSFDTGSSGDSRGWFLVNNGKTFNLKQVTLDGSGHKVWQGIRYHGQGSIDSCVFANIQFEPSGPSYAGVAVAAYGSGTPQPVDITNSTFTQIGRVGVLYFDTGGANSTFSGNTYTGKGTGDFLDYALDIDTGAKVTVSNNSVSGNRGVASVDGSTSAAFLVSTYYGPGTQATFTGNSISNSTSGIAIGYDSADASVVTASCNRIVGNDAGMTVVAAAGGAITATNNVIEGNSTGIDATGVASGSVNAQSNWWGCWHGPGSSGCDTTAGTVDFTPLLASVPACVGCTSAADCDDGDVCNGVETCNTATGMCQAGTPLPDTDGDGTCNATDNCPSVFNFGQSDGNGNGVGDLCDTETLPAPMTLSRVRLTSSSRANKATIRVTGVFDPSEVGGDLADALALGGAVAVTGGGLSADETMIFRAPRCVQLGKTRFTCIGTKAEVLKLRRKHSGLYSVTISASHRSFAPPLSTAGVQVTLTLGGLDRRDAIASCVSRGHHVTATCRK